MNNFILNGVIFGLLLLMPLGNFSESENQDDLKGISEKLLSEFGEKSDFPRRFIFNAVDLNGDKENEFLVGLMGPDFCGSGGCTMLVLNKEMKVISKMTLVEYPVYVGVDLQKEGSNGFKNIYLRTGKVGYVKLMWDGKSYPTNPSLQPKISESIISGKKKLLNAEDDPTFEF